jgi:hypothetical protein
LWAGSARQGVVRKSDIDSKQSKTQKTTKDRRVFLLFDTKFASNDFYLIKTFNKILFK